MLSDIPFVVVIITIAVRGIDVPFAVAVIVRVPFPLCAVGLIVNQDTAVCTVQFVSETTVINVDVTESANTIADADKERESDPNSIHWINELHTSADLYACNEPLGMYNLQVFVS